MPHTFQQGDRVVATINGAKGTVNRRNEHGHWLVLRDDRLAYGWSPYFSYREDSLSHDNDFQVGDWVRYEKVDEVGTEEWNGKVGVVTFVDDDETFPTASVDGIAERLLQANLVKIQPPVIFNDCYVHEPQEEPMQERQEDAIELGIQEKIRLLERQVEKAKCCLETYRDLKRFINQEDHHGTR